MTPRADMIERLLPDDTATAAQLEALCCTVLPGEPWHAAGLLESAAQETARVLFVRDGADVIGCLVGTCAAGTAEIVVVATAPSARRRGIATALLRAFWEDVSPTETFLEVRESNDAAIALYRRFGFEPVGRRRRFYHDPAEDAVVMRRDG